MGDTSLSNRPALSGAEAQTLALAHVNSSLTASLGDDLEQVILPTGSELRAAWRVGVEADVGSYTLWIDSESGAVLQALPDFQAVAARGRVFNPDPGVGTEVFDFDVEEASDGSYILGWVGLLLLSNRGADGVAGPLYLTDDGSGVANYDVDPINSTTNVSDSTAADYNSDFQSVNLYAWVHRSLNLFELRGSERLPLWWMIVNTDDPCGFGADNACGGLGTLQMGVGSATLGGRGLRNTALDATVIVHEISHGVQAAQVAVGGGRLNRGAGEGLADYFAMSILDTDIMGGWAGGGGDPVQTGELSRQADALDVFPENLYLNGNNNQTHANGQIMAWALWSTRQQLAARHPLGAYVTDLTLLRALRSAGLAMGQSQVDHSLHTAYRRGVLEKMLTQVGSTQDAAAILAGFARAGIVTGPQVAIISIDDFYIDANATELPTFTVWTGRDFDFDAADMAVATVDYNTRYEIELANDAEFTTNLVSSGVQDNVAVVNGVPMATWQIPQDLWEPLTQGTSLYFRVTTTDSEGGKVQSSLRWGDQQVALPPGFAVINNGGGTFDACDSGCATSSGGDNLASALWALLAALLVVARRNRGEQTC